MEYQSIDMDLALEQLGGSSRLYKTVVKGFSDRYSNVNLTIEEHLDQGDMEEARRMAHSMKGLSGNLGAVSLRARALELETSIKEGAPDIKVHLKAFSEELARVNEDVKAILETKYGLGERQSGTSFAQSPAGILCSALANALASLRFSEINRLVNELKKAELPPGKRPEIEKALDLIQNFEYDRAMTILKEVCKDG